MEFDVSQQDQDFDNVECVTAEQAIQGLLKAIAFIENQPAISSEHIETLQKLIEIIQEVGLNEFLAATDSWRHSQDPNILTLDHLVKDELNNVNQLEGEIGYDSAGSGSVIDDDEEEDLSNINSSLDSSESGENPGSLRDNFSNETSNASQARRLTSSPCSPAGHKYCNDEEVNDNIEDRYKDKNGPHLYTEDVPSENPDNLPKDSENHDGDIQTKDGNASGVTEVGNKAKTEVSNSLKDVGIGNNTLPELHIASVIPVELFPESYGYNCERCNRSFTASCDLKRHMHSHNTKRLALRCKICDRSYKSEFCLQKHMRGHSQNESNIKCKCLVCNKHFNRAMDLHFHRREEKHYRCPLCSEGLSSMERLITHIDNHGVEKIYCNLCDDKFITARAYVTHTKRHTGEELHKCAECGKSFLSRLAVNNHMRSHTTVRPHTCSVCSHTFKLAIDLDKHMYTSHEEKRFLCVTCGKKFGRRQNLNSHIRSHSAERPYKCDTCGKTYPRRDALVRHTKIVHSNEPGPQCPTCGKRFPSSRLARHMLIHTGYKAHTCKECGKSFNQLINLKTHTRTHTGQKPFKCKFCSVDFSHAVSLRGHVMKHHTL